MSFRQEDKIKDVGAVNPIITQPAVDNSKGDTSTAAAITAVANTGIQIYSKMQQKRGEELALQVQDDLAEEVGARSVAFQQGATEASEMAKNQGYALARGQGSLSPAQFRARAEVRLKQMMAANPFFSDEIARGFAATSGYDPRGATNAALFEQLTALQQARSGKDDWMKKKALEFNITPDSAIDPQWQTKTVNAMQTAAHIKEVENKDKATTRELRDTVLRKVTPNYVQGQAVAALANIPGLNLRPDVKGAEYIAWARGLSNEQRDAAYAELEKQKDILQTELQKIYGGVGDSTEYKTALDVITGQIDEVRKFIDSPDEDRLSRLKTSNELKNQQAIDQFRTLHPKLYDSLIVLKDHPQLAEYAFKQRMSQSFTDALGNWKVATPGLTGTFEEAQGELGFIDKVMEIGLDNNPQIGQYTAALAAWSKIGPSYYDNYDNLSPEERQGVIQKVDLFLAKVAKPGFAELISHPNFDPEQRAAIQRNLTLVLDKHLPRMYRKVADDLAKGGGSVSVSPVTGLLTLDSKAPTSTRQAVERINTGIKAVSNSTGGGSPEKYRGMLENIAGKVTQMVEAEKPKIQAPVKGKAEEYADVMKRLGELKQKPVQSSTNAEIRKLEEREKALREEIQGMVGGGVSVTAPAVSDEEMNKLRITAFRRQNPDIEKFITDEEILGGMGNGSVA